MKQWNVETVERVRDEEYKRLCKRFKTSRTSTVQYALHNAIACVYFMNAEGAGLALGAYRFLSEYRPKSADRPGVVANVNEIGYVLSSQER